MISRCLYWLLAFTLSISALQAFGQGQPPTASWDTLAQFPSALPLHYAVADQYGHFYIGSTNGHLLKYDTLGNLLASTSQPNWNGSTLLRAMGGGVRIFLFGEAQQQLYWVDRRLAQTDASSLPPENYYQLAIPAGLGYWTYDANRMMLEQTDLQAGLLAQLPLRNLDVTANATDLWAGHGRVYLCFQHKGILACHTNGTYEGFWQFDQLQGMALTQDKCILWNASHYQIRNIAKGTASVLMALPEGQWVHWAFAPPYALGIHAGGGIIFRMHK